MPRKTSGKRDFIFFFFVEPRALLFHFENTGPVNSHHLNDWKEPSKRKHDNHRFVDELFSVQNSHPLILAVVNVMNIPAEIEQIFHYTEYRILRKIN